MCVAERLRLPGSFLSFGERFTELRRAVEWLSDQAFSMTRYTLQSQCDAWKRFFKGDGHPRFKSRRRTPPNFTLPDNIRIQGDRISVPKIGRLQFRRKGGNPYPDGKPLKAVVKKRGGKWYVTICSKVSLPEPSGNGGVAGVDKNVRQVAVVTSKGNEDVIVAPDTSLLDITINRNQRKIANQASTVAVENLNTSGMTRSTRGTVENPGKNVKDRTGLDRGILAKGWRQLRQMLANKSRVVDVNPAYTSQTGDA